MAYGMKIYGPDGYSVAFDSTSPGGVFVQFVILPTTAPTNYTSVISLPATYAKMTIELYPLRSGDHSYYLTQGNPYTGAAPYITYQSTISSMAETFETRTPTILMAFAK
jgi:hypothetical protein